MGRSPRPLRPTRSPDPEGVERARQREELRRLLGPMLALMLLFLALRPALAGLLVLPRVRDAVVTGADTPKVKGHRRVPASRCRAYLPLVRRTVRIELVLAGLLAVGLLAYPFRRREVFALGLAIDVTGLLLLLLHPPTRAMIARDGGALGHHGLLFVSAVALIPGLVGVVTAHRLRRLERRG